MRIIKSNKTVKASRRVIANDDCYLDTETGEKVTYDFLRKYWDENKDSDPSLEEFNSFEEWFKVSKENGYYKLCNDVEACGDIKASIDSDIARYKKSLTQKASKSGIYENFGAAEIRKLKDKYSVYPDDTTDSRTVEHNRRSLDSFEDWCMNYVGACSNVSANEQALTHIRAAIDILGKSGKKDDITKDSIANLAVVMFDLKGE